MSRGCQAGPLMGQVVKDFLRHDGLCAAHTCITTAKGQSHRTGQVATVAEVEGAQAGRGTRACGPRSVGSLPCLDAAEVVGASQGTERMG